MLDTLNSVIKTAKAEVGYKEGKTNITKYSDFIDKNFPDFYNGRKQGAAWCDIFVDYLFLVNFGEDKALQMLCQPKKSCGAGCKFSAQYYKSKGRYGKEPKIGAQVFFGKEGNESHTGVVIHYNGTHITTIEGNSNNEVRQRSYKVDDGYISGYGYPIYDIDIPSSTVGYKGAFPVIPKKGYICKGDKGPNVKKLQLFLKWYDPNFLPRYGADSDFGSETLTAVKTFQQREGIKQDGLFGPTSLKYAKTVRK